MNNKQRAYPSCQVIRWAQPPQDVEDSRPGNSAAAVREGEVFFLVDEGAPQTARASLGRYRISVRDLLMFLRRFRVAS